MRSPAAPATLTRYRRLMRLPLGSWLFSNALAWKAPYTRSIQPRVTVLEPGRCEVRVRKRRRVLNHLGTVHAIAMANACELAAALMTEVTVPSHMRWIPKSLTVEYVAKAGSDIRAVSALPEPPRWIDGLDLRVPVQALDDAGETVVRATVTMWVTERRAQ